VSGALQTRGGADVPLKKALDGYTAVSAQPGDVATVRAANKSALEAVAIALQTVAGQFWANADFQTAYQNALAALP
jgi:hypothetical protein